jgi:outer membrane protein assembly factor BamB
VPFTVGNWYHVVATWSPNPGSKIVYINGLPRTTQASVNASIKAQTTWRMAFGNNDVGGCFGCFNGKIDEVRISNVARSAAWIATSYNNQSSPSTFHSLAAEEATGGTIIGGDQSGRVYSIDEVTGTTNWTADLTAKASSIQASVSVQLAQYASSAFRTKYGTDVLFAVSRNSATLNCGTATTNNKVFALKVTDGTSAGWTFNDTCANSMDYASGMPFVDYARDRLYVTTGNTSGPSLWILDTLNASNSASGTLVGSLALGPIDSSPSLSYDNNTVWVGSGNGFLYGIDAETLTQKWSFNLQTTLKGFVWEDYSTANRIYFTTADGYVWCLQDNGSSASPCAGWGGWPVYARTPVAGASTILLMDYIFVGSSDGKVHQLDVSTGADGTPFPAASTLDGTQVGDVSTETGGEIFVGTSGGHIFKINLVGGALP